MKNTARKHNVTGVPRLSIGTTKNSRGAVLNRYCVNYIKDGSTICKSFYFGANTSQLEAFYSACDFMIEHGLTDLSVSELKLTYKVFKHEALI